VIVSHVIKCDYPGRWALLPEKIATFIQSENTMQWMGALMSLYQMVKVYEYVMLSTISLLYQYVKATYSCDF
jgi:hypothetical protein